MNFNLTYHIAWKEACQKYILREEDILDVFLSLIQFGPLTVYEEIENECKFSIFKDSSSKKLRFPVIPSINVLKACIITLGSKIIVWLMIEVVAPSWTLLNRLLLR